MSTRLRSDPALTAAVERAREAAEATGELRARSASSPAASLSPEAGRILAAWIGDGGYSRAVAEVAVSDPDLADQQSVAATVAVVIDDHILLDLIAGIASQAVRDAIGAGAVYTTGCWYYRLARAVLRRQRGRVAVVTSGSSR